MKNLMDLKNETKPSEGSNLNEFENGTNTQESKSCSKQTPPKPSELMSEVDFASLCQKYLMEKKIADQKKKEVDTMKDQIKDYLLSTGLSIVDNSFLKLSLTTIDKSSLKEIETISLLKNKGMGEFVHSKEYFNYDEILMALNQGKISAQELNDLKVEKYEYRLNGKLK